MSIRLTLLCVIVLSVVGCHAQPPRTAATPQSSIALIPSGARYVAEANQYTDYSEDPFSYHYHGRDRDITAEEVAILELDRNLTYCRRVGDDEKVWALSLARERLAKDYAPLISALADRDRQTYEHNVKEMIAAAKGSFDSAKTAESKNK